MDTSRLKVLVADDNKASREIVIGALRQIGVQRFYQAEDGGAAYNLICVHRPDCAFIGFEIELDGLRVLNAVRRLRTSPNIKLPVVMMIASADVASVTRLRDAGANEIISKPLTVEKICSRAMAVLTRTPNFVETDSYIGPCRRRSRGAGYSGQLRRRTDAPAAVVELD